MSSFTSPSVSCRGGIVSQARVQRLKETFQTWNLADAPQVSALIQHERRVYGREEQQKEQQQQQENGDDNEKQAVVEVVAGGETSTSEIESEQRRYTVKKKEEDKQELDVCSTAETYAYALPHSAVLSLHHQESINRIRGHHRRNIPTSLSYRKKEMLKRYIVEEEDAVSLSRELDCPPCELLRGFVNDIIEKIFTNIHASERTIASSSSSSLNDTVPTDSESGVREPESLSAKLKRESKLVQAGSKKSVSKVMREPTLLLDILSILEDDPRYDDSEKALGQYEIFLVNTSVKIPFAHIFPRLVEDIIYHTCQDAMHSSLLDETRREVGDEFEENLAYCLESAGISFAREDELRRKGQAKTPDFQLHVPIFISDKCIHWIESKAMFADLKTFEEQVENQLNMYKNRFGPGLVIYWFGYEAGVGETEDDILVMDCFPQSDTIFHLPMESFADSKLYGPLGTCKLIES